MDGRKRLAWNLRRLRVERGLSQESLAVDASVDRGYVSGIERQTYSATVDVLDRLAAALKIDVSLLIAPLGDASAQPPLPLPSGRRPARDKA